MKYALCLLFGCLLFGSIASAQQVKHKPPIDGSKYIHIDDADHDFGEIPYGQPVEYPVKMKNISKDTLYLSDIIVSCGCTTPEYKKGAYPPGAEIEMKVGFNGHANGAFNKTLSVLFQDKDDQIVKILRFRGKGVKQ